MLFNLYYLMDDEAAAFMEQDFDSIAVLTKLILAANGEITGIINVKDDH